MYAYILKILEFFQKNVRKLLIFCGFMFILLCIYWLLCGKYVSDNGNTVDQVRTELNRVEGSKQDIADTAGDITSTSTDIAETVGNLANSINNVTNTSKQFDSIIGECQNIIEQIRKQPAGK